MGMTKDSQRGLSKGLELFEDIMDFAGLAEEVKISRSGEYAETARMQELDAMQEFAWERWDNEEEARLLHEELERDRSLSHAEWGQSGLAMSGSTEMVLEGQREQDIKAEANRAFLDGLEEQDILDDGLRGANRYRIAKGRKPSTTLSLGSNIYKTRY